MEKEIDSVDRELLAKYDKEHAYRTSIGKWAWVVSILGISLTIFHLYTALKGPYVSIIQGSIHLGSALAIIYILYPAKKSMMKRSGVHWYDLILAAAALYSNFYIVFNYERLTTKAIVLGFNQIDIIVASLGVLLILEATLLAIRTAMAYTGKMKLAKFEGHYHGGYDQVLLSVNPDLDKAGEAHMPISVPESKGIPDYYVENTVILPFNDLEATEQILRTNAHEIAGVILEPIQGGFIPADLEFMKGLRKITEELGILLIFDEVKTGFRLSLGGAQKIYDVNPDLTALGKVLGGGFPVGAIGGKRDIMMVMAPNQGRDILSAGAENTNKSDSLFHSGTYNGHPTILAAGLATIHELEQEGVMDGLFAKTQILRSQLETVYKLHGINMQTIGKGSIFNIILAGGPIKNYRDLSSANMKLRKEIDYELLKLGIYTKPLNRYSMSIAHDDADITRTVEAHDEALKKVLG